MHKQLNISKRNLLSGQCLKHGTDSSVIEIKLHIHKTSIRITIYYTVLQLMTIINSLHYTLKIIFSTMAQRSSLKTIKTHMMETHNVT